MPEIELEQNFKPKYELIIFDLDGVITSEKIYWQISKEVTADILKLAGIKSSNPLEENFIKLIKNSAINSNWDLTFINTALHLLGGNKRTEFEQLASGLYGSQLIEQIYIMSGQNEAYKVNGQLWEQCYTLFQTKFMQSKHIEQPIIEIGKITSTLQSLKNLGIKLGIATGRPLAEAKSALEQFGIWQFFDQNHIATFDDVAQEQQKNGGAFKGKPHPFQLIKAMAGLKHCIMVGDTASDIQAANNLNKEAIRAATKQDWSLEKIPYTTVAAVLSGCFDESDIEQKKQLFESLKADYILQDITEIEQCLQ